MAQPPSSFPTTLADIQFTQQPDHNLYKTLKTLRKSTLSIPHRLRAIFLDARFVEELQQYLIQSNIQPASAIQQSQAPYGEDQVRAQVLNWPLIANERAGSWYLSPALKAGSAYFKSTDGHYGQWDFSLRRLNLPVLEILGKEGCAILVDSTRRGKDFPDALRRTVPIWTETWNRVLFPEVQSHELGGFQVKDLGSSEVAQIESRISAFADSLRALSLPLKELRRKVKKPIRCVWVCNQLHQTSGNRTAKQDIEDLWSRHDCNILVLCSASCRVIGAEMSEDGYIQGAGDDSEGWSCGLTPQLAWKYKDQLLSSNDENIGSLIDSLIFAEQASLSRRADTKISPTQNLYMGCNKTLDAPSEAYDLRIDCNSPATVEFAQTLGLGCREGKLGSKDLKRFLGKIRTPMRAVFEKDATSSIFVCCSTGRDLSVGVALAILCLFYNESGCVDLLQEATTIDKQFVKRRLVWITSCRPDINPSRATLQAVHAFLIDRPG